MHCLFSGITVGRRTLEEESDKPHISTPSQFSALEDHSCHTTIPTSLSSLFVIRHSLIVQWQALARRLKETAPRGNQSLPQKRLPTRDSVKQTASQGRCQLSRKGTIEACVPPVILTIPDVLSLKYGFIKWPRNTFPGMAFPSVDFAVLGPASSLVSFSYHEEKREETINTIHQRLAWKRIRGHLKVTQCNCIPKEKSHTNQSL